MRSWEYNRFGVLMGASSLASCPRWPSLRGYSWPMITLFSLQGDFCATAVMRDLIVGTFNLLQHTPLHKLGINIDMHFRMDSEASWHAFGHRLAPKDLWQDTLKNPGMRSLTMEGQRPDAFRGYIRVQVEPSIKIHPGVYVRVNDHYEIETLQPGTGSDAMLDI